MKQSRGDSWNCSPSALAPRRSALAQEKITYNMAWLPQGSSIGVIVAPDRGYFKEFGIDVNIVRGYGGNRTANELDQGQFEIGYVDPISLILNRTNGGKIRLVGAINTRWPAGICYVTKRNQKSIDDLNGLHARRRLSLAGAQRRARLARDERQTARLHPAGAPRPGGGRHLAHRGQDRSRRVLAGEQAPGAARSTPRRRGCRSAG